MTESNRNRQNEPVASNQENVPREQLKPQEKTNLGGDFNSGVTSNDPAERDEIEKKGGMANIDQSSVGPREEDPDAAR